MINKVILIGRVGKDPDVKTVSGGTTIANFTLATSEKWKDKGGERKEKTEWHRCVAFNVLAGIVRDYVSKGSLIYVEGKIQTRQWERDGQQQYVTEIIVNSLQLLSPKKDNYDSKVNQVKEHFDAKPVEEDDQIPF